MDKLEQKDFVIDINTIRQLDIESLFLIIRKSISAAFNSFLTFGPISPITKDALKALREYIGIIKESSTLYDYLLSYKDTIDSEEASLFLEEILKLNNETVEYYVDVLLDIKSSALNNEKWRAKRSAKNFDLITETLDYRAQAIGLTLTIEDICKYFNFPSSFLEYIRDRIKILDSHDENQRHFYLVNMKLDSNNVLTNFRINVPAIINLHTAKVNVHEFRHAYDLYNLLGQRVDDDEYFEVRAREEEKRFVKQYVYSLLDREVM